MNSIPPVTSGDSYDFTINVQPEKAPKAKDTLLTEINQAIHELKVLTLEENGIGKIIAIRSKIQKLKTTAEGEENFADLIRMCEEVFKKTLVERNNNLLSIRVRSCKENRQWEDALRLMVDHPEWVEHNLDVAANVIKTLGQRELDEASQYFLLNKALPPKSIGGLVARLFRNNPGLEKLGEDFTFFVGNQTIRSNTLLVLNNISMIFSIGSNDLDRENPSIKLICEPDSLKTILTFFVSNDEELLLPMFEENYLTANLYGINCVIRALRNQIPRLRDSMAADAWNRRVLDWQQDPALEPLARPLLLKVKEYFAVPAPVPAVAPVKFKEEHEERIFYSLDLMEKFLSRLEMDVRDLKSIYLSLHQVREAAELLLRTASSGQIKDNEVLFQRYLSILERAMSKHHIIEKSSREKEMLRDNRFSLFHEEELMYTLFDTADFVNAISVCCASAQNMLKSQLPVDLLKDRAWHGETLKMALRMIGKESTENAQELVMKFAANAIRKQMMFNAGCYYVLLRHSSSTILPAGQHGSVITATYWDPIIQDVRSIRIHAINEGNTWTYRTAGNTQKTYLSVGELVSGLWSSSGRHILWVKRPDTVEEVRYQYTFN